MIQFFVQEYAADCSQLIARVIDYLVNYTHDLDRLLIDYQGGAVE